MNNAYIAGAWLRLGYRCEVKVSRGRIHRHALNGVYPYKDKKKLALHAIYFIMFSSGFSLCW